MTAPMNRSDWPELIGEGWGLFQPSTLPDGLQERFMTISHVLLEFGEVGRWATFEFELNGEAYRCEMWTDETHTEEDHDHHSVHVAWFKKEIPE